MPLSPAELRALKLARVGCPTPEIAGRLRLSIDTVERHLQSIYEKLGIPSSRKEWVRVLLREKMLEAERRGHHMQDQSAEGRRGVAICDRPGCSARILVGYREGWRHDPIVLSVNASNSPCLSAG